MSHNAPPLVCYLLLRLFRFGFDFVFGLKFVCSGESLYYLVSAAALILFDQESPSPLTCLNNCVAFITEILDFSCSLGESPPSALRIDLHERLKRSVRMHFDSLSRSKQKHCFCAAKALARLDRANDTPISLRKISNLHIVWCNHVYTLSTHFFAYVNP